MKRRGAPRVISLFTGAGGLDLGLEAAGFENRVCIELDPDARATLRSNRPDWTVATPGDVHHYVRNPDELLALMRLRAGDVELLAGGPPCQPFSKSGYWSRGRSLRLADPRARTLGAYLRIVEAALPHVVLLENVRAFTFAGKDEGLRLLEDGFRHINRRRGTKYTLNVLHLNAANFGVAQFRERVFVIASRDGKTLEPPRQTHGEGTGLLRFATAWDAIGSLDKDRWAADLDVSGKWAQLLPSVPEGHNYLWHTPGSGGKPLFGWRTRYWSFLLKLAKAQPSWTIQAEPGPATGPFHWRNRLLSVRELCRLQTFPDDYSIYGDRRSAQRQVGNAVPCALAEILGLEIRRQFLGDRGVRSEVSLLPCPRRNCPPPERVRRVRAKYLKLLGDHRPHPGTGLGPGARKRSDDASQRAA
jgi:DNA (cytosine-5)-methyltransferase 1